MRLLPFILFLFLTFVLTGCEPYHSASDVAMSQQMKKTQPHYAPVKDGHIEYYRFGQGSPIVLIPGYMTDVSSWDKEFLATLAKEHEVIVLNNRNVAGSVIDSSHYEAKDLANDTNQLIRDLHLKKPAILGISMGGMIAQQLAVSHQQTVGALILINTAIAGKAAVHPTPQVEKKMMTMPTSKLGRYTTAVQLFFPPSWRTQMAFALAFDRFEPEGYTDIEPDNVMSQQQQLVEHWISDNKTARKIKHLHLPVLILNGTADIAIPPINSLILAHTIPHAELIRWNDGGHAMIYQYPKETATAINEFIASITS